MSAPNTPVYCVDDHVQSMALVRAWIERSPGLEWIGSAETIARALIDCRRLRPRVIVLDVVLGDGDSLDHLDEFNALPGAPRILLHTGWRHEAFIARLRPEMVDGVIWKSGHKEELLEAIASAAAGRPYWLKVCGKSGLDGGHEYPEADCHPWRRACSPRAHWVAGRRAEKSVT